MIVVDPRSRLPFYKQIQEQILLFIRLGILKPNDQLPSIREVAASASLNFNTVKKAFGELETLGILYTVPGKGNFVSENAMQNTQMRQSTLQNLSAALRSAVANGITSEEILELVKTITAELEGTV